MIPKGPSRFIEAVDVGASEEALDCFALEVLPARSLHNIIRQEVGDEPRDALLGLCGFDACAVRYVVGQCNGDVLHQG